MSTPQAELIARYMHLRRVGRELNNRLFESVSRSAKEEGGRKLGMLRGNVLTLDTHDTIVVFADYCIHDVRRHGVNAVERYRADHRPPAESDEAVLLDALAESRYTLSVVESTEPGVGVHVRDLLRDEARFVVDIGLSQSATADMVLATRIFAPEGLGMMTGAELPGGVMSASERGRFLRSLKSYSPGMDFANLAPEEASNLNARIIRTFLRSGAAEYIRYVDVSQSASRPRAKRTRRNRR